MYDPRTPTLAAVEKERKTPCNAEELHDKSKKRRAILPSHQSGSIHQSRNSNFSYLPLFYFFLQAALHSFFPRCDDCLSALSDPEEDFQPLTLSGLDRPTNSIVIFLSSLSSPP